MAGESSPSVSGSMSMSSDLETYNIVCSETNLAVGGGTWLVIVNAMNSSGLTVESDSLDSLACSQRRLQDGRRLQEVSYTVTYEVQFDDVASASTFAEQVVAAQTEMATAFVEQAASVLEVEVSDVTVSIPVVTDPSDEADEADGVQDGHLGAIVGIIWVYIFCQ